MPGIESVSERAECAPDAGHPPERESLKRLHHSKRNPVEHGIHSSTKTNLTHTIVEVLGTRHDLNFHSHEINRQIAPVNFREADGVLLRGDDGGGLTFLASIDSVQDLLLG